MSIVATASRQSPGPKVVNSVLAALEVLEALSLRQPIGVSDLARAVHLPKSNAQRLLLTLERAGWARREHDGTSRWTLTSRPFTVGGRAVQRYGLLDAARPVMQQLRDLTEETVHLVMLDGGGLVSVERFESPRAVRIAAPLGGWAPLHATSPGKAILSCLSAEEVDRLLVEPLPRYTPATITDRAELNAQLQRARGQGFAVNRGEWREGVTAAGAAIELASGRPIAGLAISSPASRTRRATLQRHGELVAAAARQISGSIEQAPL